METAGYLASIFIGISLGLIGGGGSVLTVPVLVYLFRIEPVLATGYSLFIVGITSAVGSVAYFRKGLVSLRTAIVFGLPSIAAVYATRVYLLPIIPAQLLNIGNFAVTKDILLMLLFAILMIAASYTMIKKDSKTDHMPVQKLTFNYPVILLEGVVVGTLTGLVGAGGGFLIIPALVLLSKLPMKEAVGTSLVIIAAKSLIGFLGEAASAQMNWPALLSITSFAILGIFIGTAVSKKIDGAKLKPAFGWFVLIMGVYILLRETSVI